MEDPFADIRNELGKVEQQIAKKEAALKATYQEIKEAEQELKAANDHEDKARRLDEKLKRLSERERAIRAELVKLNGQADAYATQFVERERRLALASEAKRRKTLPLAEPPNGPSRKFYDALHRLSGDLHLPDAVDGLQTTIQDLQMPPLLVLPTIYATLTEQGLLAPDEAKWVQLAPDDAEAAVLISNDIHHAVLHNGSVEESENTMHSLVDAVLASTCERAFRGCRRNQSETSSVGRPDFFVPVHVSGTPTVTFQGEEKLASQARQSHPRDELVQKTPWDDWEQFYADLPYIFCYFAIGGPDELLLQFGCLVRDSRTFVSIGRQYNLAEAMDRVHAFLFFLKLVPFIQAAANRASGAPLDILWEDHRGDEVALRFAVIDGVVCVQKKYELRSRENLRRLQHAWVSRSAFFLDITGSGNYFVPILGVSTHVKPPEYAVVVYFSRCDHVKKNLTNVLTAIYHTIEALEILHAHSCVHNDIRWANVMFSPTVERYVLIDFDESALLEEDGFAPSVLRELDAASHAPNIRERHGPEVDVWGVGYMMVKQRCAPWLAQLGLQIINPDAAIPTLSEVKGQFIHLLAERNIELPPIRSLRALTH